MWAELWPGVPVKEVPIISITNGVHLRGWLSDEMGSLYERYLGTNWTDDAAKGGDWQGIEQIPDEELWRTHQRCKEQLIVFARNRLKAQMQRRGTYHSELNWAEEVLDPEVLTIGFARRFASYKRGNLLLKDPARFVKLLSDTKRPMQIIFAGKAHPRDTEGKEIIRQIIHFASQYDVRRRMVFLEDYDINVARYLVHGVDVWLNTPRRPMEASGTSGMKAAVNGALNMSTLDGWWCEAYKSEAGWAIGSGEDYEDPIYQDMVESQAMYNILENEAGPLFYTRSADNLPRGWIRRMKNSIRLVTGRFSTDRMVREYLYRFYNPSAARWRYLTAEAMTRARALSAWKKTIRDAWRDFVIKDIRVELDSGNGAVEVNPKETQLKIGSKVKVTARVGLGAISPNNVSVELYHGVVDALGNIKDGSTAAMVHERPGGDQPGEHWFTCVMSCQQTGQYGLTVRILPRHTDLADPYEPGLILWEKQDS
jgi:starch phosphorylase